MSDQLAAYDAHQQLAASQERFYALAQVAGNEMARVFKPILIPPVAAVVGGVTAYTNAKFGNKGLGVTATIGGLCWLVSYLSKENADMRNGAVAIASGIGTSISSVWAYDKQTVKMAAISAPVATAA